MTASAVASEPSLLLKLPVEQLKELCLADCKLGYVVMGNVARVLAERLMATRQQLLGLNHEVLSGSSPWNEWE